MKPNNMTPMSPEQLRERMVAALRRAEERRYQVWTQCRYRVAHKVWSWRLEYSILLKKEAEKYGISYY